MEYNFYLEQKYLHSGRVEARILTAAQAEAMGYEDDYRSRHADYKVYVMGSTASKLSNNHLNDLADCTLVE